MRGSARSDRRARVAADGHLPCGDAFMPLLGWAPGFSSFVGRVFRGLLGADGKNHDGGHRHTGLGRTPDRIVDKCDISSDNVK